MTGSLVLRQKNTYLRRCDLCRNLTHYIYNVKFDNLSYNLCSNSCIGSARKNYEEKIKNGVYPANPAPIEEEGL